MKFDILLLTLTTVAFVSHLVVAVPVDPPQLSKTAAELPKSSSTSLRRLNAIKGQPPGQLLYAKFNALEYEYLRYIAAAHVNYYLKLNYNVKKLSALLKPSRPSTAGRVKGWASRMTSKGSQSTSSNSPSSKRAFFLSSKAKGSPSSGLFNLSIAQSDENYGTTEVSDANPFGYLIPSLVDYIFLRLRTVKLEEGLFRTPPNQAALSELVKQLNFQPKFAKATISKISKPRLLAGTLTRYFRLFTDPIMTNELVDLWSNSIVVSNSAVAYELAQMLPQKNHNLLAVILANLRWAVTQQAVTLMGPSQLAQAVTQCLYYDDMKTALHTHEHQKVLQFFYSGAHSLDYVPRSIVSRYNKLRASFVNNGQPLAPAKVFSLILADVAKDPPVLKTQANSKAAKPAASRDSSANNAQKKST